MVKIFRCFRVQHLTFLQIVANFDFETLHIMIFQQKDRKDVEGCLAETSFHQVHWGGIEYPPWELAQRALRRIEVPSFAFGATSGVGAGGSRVLVSFVRLPLEKMSPLMRGHGKSCSRGVSSISMFFFSTKCFLVFWRGMIIIHIHTKYASSMDDMYHNNVSISFIYSLYWQICIHLIHIPAVPSQAGGPKFPREYLRSARIKYCSSW